jgi:hypothetical protein
MCGVSFTAAGFVTASQTPNDCHQNQCDGAGNITSAVDDADVPADDGNPCTSETCNAGTPQHPPVTPGTACNQNGGTKCNAVGVCVQCLAQADCPANTACQTHACVAGFCSNINTAAGTVVGNPVPGDCRSNQCNGSGSVTNNAVDNSDVPPDDGNQCTSESCVAGTPQHPNVPQGTSCNQNGGSTCNGSGACVTCLTAADCGVDTACQTHTCIGGVCGANNAAAGTVVSNPVTGDCRSNQCDGVGNIQVNAPDNNDTPADDGNQCTSDICVAGAPQHPPTGSGSPCNQGGGIKCDGAGACVQCIANSDCGTDTACQLHVCSAGACGVNNVGAGVVVSNPVPGDCHSNQCDGSGNITANAVDINDVPADDGNQCTAETCVAGAPAHPPVGAGTACSQNGGTECDGNGNCVQCLADADCGTNTACQTHVCTSGVCNTNNVGAGTVVGNPTAGDCHTNQCDGAGNIVNAIDDNDLPVDGNACTGDVCTSGVPSNPALASGTACGQNGGTECDGIGDCVQCVNDAECPGTTNECQHPTCTSGVCGHFFVGAGTATSAQTSGDCLINECDGAGNIVPMPDDGDAPASTQCATHACSSGTVTTTPVAIGTTCNENGGLACDGAGACTLAVAVVRVGDGSATLGSTATAVFLEARFVSNGTLLPLGTLNPLAMPTVASGSNARLTVSGSASSEGALALSGDGHYVTLAGYDAAVGTAGVASTTSAATNRIVGRVDASGNIDTSTKITSLISGNNVRSAVTNDGTSFWVGGAVNGVVYIAHGATGGEKSILASPPNVRVVDIFAGQLFGSSGSKNFTNVFAVGSGLPTTSTIEIPLPGMPTTGTVASPYAYAPVSTNVLYVADDGTSTALGGVQKWTLSGSTWTLTTTFTSAGGVRGVTAFVTGSTTTVVATTTATSSNALVVFVDDGVNLNPTATTIASAATNTVFRGVALAPH